MRLIVILPRSGGSAFQPPSKSRSFVAFATIRDDDAVSWGLIVILREAEDLLFHRRQKQQILRRFAPEDDKLYTR